jgi:hypothetical protein
MSVTCLHALVNIHQNERKSNPEQAQHSDEFCAAERVNLISSSGSVRAVLQRPISHRCHNRVIRIVHLRE